MRILFLILLTIFIFIIPVNLFAVEITSPNAILIEMESGKVLYEKEADKPIYPASTTKILTTIMAIENCDLNEEVTASYNAIMSVPWDGSTAAIQVGETWTVQQLVDAMMVCSANEAANIIAEHIGGDIESFASMMNARAKELGATSTNFVNPNGLHDENHKTTARDMALIARYGMLNLPSFRKAVTLQKFSLPNTSIYDKGNRNFTNTNTMIIPDSTYFYEYCTGIKTGYTSKSLNCIVASAKKDGVELIAAVFGATGALNRTNDTKALFEYGFSQLKNEKFLSANSIIDNIKINGASLDANTVDLVISGDITHTIPIDKSITDYPPVITLNNNIKAPIESGDILGTISYDIEGVSYNYNLIARNSVGHILNNVKTAVVSTAKVIGTIILWSVVTIICLFILLVLLRVAVLTKKQKIRKRRMTLYNSRFR